MIQRAKSWLENFGTGLGSSRLITGNFEELEKLEMKVASWKGAQSALIMNTGYQANVTVLSTLFDPAIFKFRPVVFSDKLIHSSMQLGCSVKDIQQIRFLHNDLKSLESKLSRFQHSDQPKFILVESVYSMSGQSAEFKKLLALRDEYKAFLIVDEAHASGVYGPKGSGLGSGADLTIGTFGKAMGSFGSYVACSQEIKNYLINRCPGFIYTTALPPSILGSIDGALDLVPNMQEQREHIKAVSTYFRSNLDREMYSFGNANTHIIPVRFPNEKSAIECAEFLKENGLWAKAILPPTVTKNKICIRFSICAWHTLQDIDILVTNLKKFRSR